LPSPEKPEERLPAFAAQVPVPVSGWAQTLRAFVLSYSPTGANMKTLRSTLLTLLLLAGAGATIEAQQSPPPPEKPAFDAAGLYDLKVTFGGQPMAVTLELIKDKDGWRGSGGNPDIGMAAVSSVTQEGRNVRVTLTAEDGPTFLITLTVKADSTVEGKWEGNGDGSAITGKKTR
jgi:hypothetical protein